MKVSLLVPAYNEAATIEQVLEKLLALPLAELEVIVVDDGSRDATADLAQSWADRDERVRVIRQPRNLGKTAAIARAIAVSSGQVLMIQDADLEYDPDEIPHVLAPIFEQRADVVYGSRFMVRRAARVLYFYHYLANKGLTFLSNLLTNRNMSDIETCYKAFRAEVVKPLRLTSRGFGLEVELTAMICRTHARTYEVPISYHGRTYQEGKKIGWRDGLAALWYIAYYNLLRPWSPEGRRYVKEVNAALAQPPKHPPGPPA